jgi:class 3 adenylate cyclase|tara:strand:+ start:140 stop:1306 length:1167 start_codon:yes stop_codon:yes gene_type:complete
MNNTRNRSLAAIMFTDVVGFSAIMHKDESAALELLDNHNKIVQPIVIKYNGTILKPQADGYLMKFSSAVDAVRCGKDIQKEISIYNKEINENENILLRIGIHLGDVVLTENDIFGDGVNIASRLEPLADPGGICISQTVYDQIKNKVEIQTLDLGPADLKNIDSKINIYKVLLEAQKKVEDDNEEGAQKEDTEEPKVSESVDESKLKEAIKEKIKKSIKDSLGSEIPTINIKEKDEEITIGPGGIKVKEKDGSEVNIGLSGINIKDKTGKNKKLKKKKISNLSNAIFNLISGVAFLVIIIGLFTKLYNFWPEAVIYSLAITIFGSSLKTLLEHNLKKSIIKLMSGIAFLVIIVGLFTNLYSFWPYGVIGAIAIGILIGSLKSLFGIKD